MNNARSPQLTDFPSKIIFWGGTGQAIVNRPIVEAQGSRIVAVFDDTPGLKSPFSDVGIYQGWDGFLRWKESQKHIRTYGFCLAIGNPHGRIRLELHEKLTKEGLRPVSIIHSTAFVDESAVLGEGIQVMAGAIILPGVRIGKQCIINTKASVDHDCTLEDGIELTPGVTLCGNVHIETNAWICAGATVLPWIRVGHDSVVGAGSVVTKDVRNNKLVYGVPAREIRDV
jgi:sugar O-acyltransferase (sialic acid O-acetyltransferase NeuD family)